MLPTDPVAKPEPRNGAGRFALQCGVIAVVTALIPFIGDFIAAPLALLAVVLGTVGYLRAEDGAASNAAEAVTGGVLGVAAGLIIFTTYIITAVEP